MSFSFSVLLKQWIGERDAQHGLRMETAKLMTSNKKQWIVAMAQANQRRHHFAHEQGIRFLFHEVFNFHF